MTHSAYSDNTSALPVSQTGTGQGTIGGEVVIGFPSSAALNVPLRGRYEKVALIPGADTYPPPVQREFRAAWITSVWNKDWPSRDNLSAQQQQAEAIAILARARQLNLNAVIFQVRPMGDALYSSKTEPWSQFLTGKVGANPGYDPLAFWVTEAHKRGLELHAWFNPYRAGSTEYSNYPANHVSKSKPAYVLPYGKSLWLDPGQRDVNAYVRNVVNDVVRRYNIDGVHFDDYFYPYGQKDAAGKPLPFSDDASYQKYRAGGGRLLLADWRRSNVNALVSELYRDIKRIKPSVKFGISPFGIWRSGTPPGVRGLNAVDELYADSRLWLQRGWVDYLTPQLYWPIKAPAQSYPVLLKWWSEQNVQGRHLWPGHAAHRIGMPGYSAAEIHNQLLLTRAQATTTPSTRGGVLFGWTAVMQDKGGIARELGRLWVEPALVPASPWLDAKAPVVPSLQATPQGATGLLRVRWQSGKDAKPARWVLQTLNEGTWNTQILPAAQVETTISPSGGTWPQLITLSAVDRVGNQSAPAAVRLIP